jgi:O-acetyl-ADP-ribose deacetylase (regulator of RNase III)
MGNISLLLEDITTANVDAIVNAANIAMLGGGGVDGAIHRAAGSELLEECKKIQPVHRVRCPIGEARITPAGRLMAKYVIHTVGPRYALDKNPEILLQGAYKNALQLALEHKCTSLAFPAISCGVYGYPVAEAAHIALEECSKPAFNDLEISFYLFSQNDFVTWESVLRSL